MSYEGEILDQRSTRYRACLTVESKDPELDADRLIANLEYPLRDRLKINGLKPVWDCVPIWKDSPFGPPLHSVPVMKRKGLLAAWLTVTSTQTIRLTRRFSLFKTWLTPETTEYSTFDRDLAALERAWALAGLPKPTLRMEYDFQ